MSRPHIHSSTAETQNQGNALGERACIRQSKLFRTHESGNVMKGLLGSDNLAWKTNVQEGAYAGRSTYDHNNPYPHHQRSSHSSLHESQQSVREPPRQSNGHHSHERSYAYEYNRESHRRSDGHQSTHPQHPSGHSYDHRESQYDHRESQYDQEHEHESAHQSTALTHRNNRTNASNTTTASNTRAIDDPRIRALAEQRVRAAVAASQVISMGSHGHHAPTTQSLPGHRQKPSLDYTTTTSREHAITSYKQPQASANTRPW